METVASYGTDGGPLSGPQRRLRTLSILGMAGLLGLFGGALSATGRPELTAIFIGLLIVLLVISSRMAIFWCVVGGALVVTGACQLYLPNSRYIRYVVPLASLALFLHWITDYFNQRTRKQGEPMPRPIVWAFVFALIALASVLVNLSDPLVSLIGMKDYFQMWGLLLGLVLLRWTPRLGRNMFRGLILIGLVQLPFVVHQYRVLVPQRLNLGQGSVPVDVVAGTFGASLYGGGATAVLAAFLVILAACLLAMWKNGAISTLRAVVLSAVLLAPLLFNEVKIVVLYVPLAFAVVFHRDIIARPVKFLMAGVVMTGLLTVLMATLMLTHAGKFQNWEEMVDFVVARQTADVSERGSEYSELTRVTALTFWAKEHVAANPVNTFLGHGLASSRVRPGGLDLSATLAEKRYGGLNIGYTAVSALLWDVGIVGLAAVLGMFASAFTMAGSLARHYRGTDKFKTGLFEGLQAGVAVLALSLASRDYFVVHLPFQAFTYLLIGFICYSWLEVQRGEGQGRPA